MLSKIRQQTRNSKALMFFNKEKMDPSFFSRYTKY